MLLIASCLSLLVVYAGIKLLIQTNKETLGHMYRCSAWGFIIGGFLILACTGACCIARCCKYGMGMHKEHKMMMHEGGEEMGGYHKKFMKMMKHHHCGNGEGCTVNINCGDDEMEKCYGRADAWKTDTVKYRR